jgi:hypothetical protein
MLNNLNNLHQHLSASYPAAVMPYYRVEQVGYQCLHQTL